MAEGDVGGHMTTERKVSASGADSDRPSRGETVDGRVEEEEIHCDTSR